jgi:hypothetical protein
LNKKDVIIKRKRRKMFQYWSEEDGYDYEDYGCMVEEEPVCCVQIEPEAVKEQKPRMWIIVDRSCMVH